jgi:hypothetical protein
LPVIFFSNADFENAAPAANLSSAELINKIYQAQTHDELQKALDILPQPTQSAPQSMQPPLREDRRLVIREGEEGGVLSQTEFKIGSFASEFKLKKRASNALIELVSSRDFNPQDIHVSSIQQIEKLAMKANEGGTVTRHNFWREGDGDQDVSLIVRSLGVIIQDLVADTQFAGYQYLSYELVERDGVRFFSNANGCVWWQINAHLVGPDLVLLGLVAYTDESWMKKSRTCASVYGIEIFH